MAYIFQILFLFLVPKILKNCLKIVEEKRGARQIRENQKPPNSRNQNRQIEEPLSESSRNRKWQSLCYSGKKWQVCEIVET